MLRTERSAQLIDRFEAPQSCRTGKDVDVHHSRFRPRMEDGMRLAENQHACEARFRKRMKELLDDGRARAAERRAKNRHDRLWRATDEIRAPTEVDREKGRRHAVRHSRRVYGAISHVTCAIWNSFVRLRTLISVPECAYRSLRHVGV